MNRIPVGNMSKNRLHQLHKTLTSDGPAVFLSFKLFLLNGNHSRPRKNEGESSSG